MPRPRRYRKINSQHDSFFFKPRGVPMSQLRVEVLKIDELEAMRFVDIEGMYQEDAAKLMGISRATFGRILTSGRKKVTRALVSRSAIEFVTQIDDKEE